MSRPKAVFNQLNIVCRDLEASLKFYRRLGIEVPDGAVWRTPSGAHHASVEGATGDSVDLDFDSATFAQVWNMGWRGRPDLAGRAVAGFRVPSRGAVDEIYADLTGAGYNGLQPPYDAFWGARYAIVEDPDGLAVGLMSPISPERRAPPPDV